MDRPLTVEYAKEIATAFIQTYYQNFDKIYIVYATITCAEACDGISRPLNIDFNQEQCEK